MLEANTDRSYFMIGAVVVAAILIAGAVFLFNADSGVLADIKTSLSGLTGKASTAVGTIETPAPPTPTP